MALRRPAMMDSNSTSVCPNRLTISAFIATAPPRTGPNYSTWPPSFLMQIIHVLGTRWPAGPVDQAGTLNSVLTPKPTANAKAAAAIPMKNVSSPDRHHVASAHRLLIAPIPKKATPVAVAHVASPPGER